MPSDPIEFDLRSRETVFSSLPPGGVGAEIGVANGGFSKVILANAEPSLFYLIDCWEHQTVGDYGHDPANVPQEEQDARYHRVLKWAITAPGVRVIKGYSAIISLLFPDAFFDWLYIDANHLKCGADMYAWWPKVKPGGYLMGHDYCTVGDFIRVKEDVDRFVELQGLPLLVTDDPVYKVWIIGKP